MHRQVSKANRLTDVWDSCLAGCKLFIGYDDDLFDERKHGTFFLSQRHDKWVGLFLRGMDVDEVRETPDNRSDAPHNVRRVPFEHRFVPPRPFEQDIVAARKLAKHGARRD